MIGISRDGVDIHHIIPRNVYDDLEFNADLRSLFHINDAIQNGIALPSNWHWNHPAYDLWIRNGLRTLQGGGGVTAEAIGQLRAAAMTHLQKGVGLTNFNTINQYWINASIKPY